jgi:ABC-type Fe3+-hydroxamate transport system substrate-binding protein
VGRSETSIWPPEAESVPKIITFPELNAELVAHLRPDCILLATEDFANADTIRDAFAQGGVPVLVQRFASMQHLLQNIRTLGTLADRQPQADAYATKIARFVDSLRARTAPTIKYGTVVLLRTSPLVVAGGHSFVNELIETAGGSNLFAHLNGQFVEVPMDTLIARRPELIFLPPGPPDQLNDLVSQYPQLADVPALLNNQAYEWDVERYQHPSPHTPEALVRLTNALHANLGAPLLFEAIFGPAQP